MAFNYLNIYIRQARNLPKEGADLFSLVGSYHSWRKALVNGKSTMSDGVPWMTFDAIKFLRRNVTKEMKVFEYGSGGSSVFFSQLAGEVVSVEHDKEWFSTVEKAMAQRGIKNWRGFLAEPEVSSSKNGDSSDPRTYSTSDEATRNFSFERYVKTIEQFPDEYFNFIIIDGRSRPSCIMHSISKLKKGGFLLLDNADRDNYAMAMNKYLTDGFVIKVDTYGPTSHNPDFTITKIWQKR